MGKKKTGKPTKFGNLAAKLKSQARPLTEPPEDTIEVAEKPNPTVTDATTSSSSAVETPSSAPAATETDAVPEPQEILEEIPRPALPPLPDEDQCRAREEACGTALFPRRQHFLAVVPDDGPGYVLPFRDFKELVEHYEELQHTPGQAFIFYDAFLLPATKGPERQILLPGGERHLLSLILPADYDVFDSSGLLSQGTSLTPEPIYQVAPAPTDGGMSLSELVAKPDALPAGTFDPAKLLPSSTG